MYQSLSHEDKLPHFTNDLSTWESYFISQSDWWLLYLAAVRRFNHVPTLYCTRINWLLYTLQNLYRTRKNCHTMISQHEDHISSRTSDWWLLYLNTMRRPNHVSYLYRTRENCIQMISTWGSYFALRKSNRWSLYLAAVRRFNHVPTLYRTRINWLHLTDDLSTWESHFISHKVIDGSCISLRWEDLFMFQSSTARG
jgi:hypothetical protein